MIRFENVTKQYTNNRVAVSNMSLEIQEGEFFVFIGPSGSGKTTSLKMINRLISLTAGTITINGRRISDYNIHKLRYQIGYVLQQIALFPHMTVAENIAIVPELKNWDKTNIYNRITELLDSVGLDPNIYRNAKPKELSGGEQQRIGVLRALAADPPIILMDEPFSALDPISRQKLQQDISNLQKKIKKTIVFVTHDMQEALALGDRICLMKNGRIVQVDTPKNILKNPENNFVRNFLKSGNVNLLDCGVSKNHPIQSLIELQLFEPINEKNKDIFSLSVKEPLANLINRLNEAESVAITNEAGGSIGIIKAQHVVCFLSKTLNNEVNLQR